MTKANKCQLGKGGHEKRKRRYEKMGKVLNDNVLMDKWMDDAMESAHKRES